MSGLIRYLRLCRAIYGHPAYAAVILGLFLAPMLAPVPYHGLNRLSAIFLTWIAYRAGRTRPLHALARESWMHMFVRRGAKGWRLRFWFAVFVATHPAGWWPFVKHVVLRIPRQVEELPDINAETGKVRVGGVVKNMGPRRTAAQPIRMKPRNVEDAS